MMARGLLAFVVTGVLVAGCSSGSSDVDPSRSTGPPASWSTRTDPKALPLGDGHVSTTAAARESLFACTSGNPAGGGAFADGPWIHGTTWDATAKLAVQGAHTWPAATLSITTDGTSRTIVTNDLPAREVTGTFPIAATDPAYRFDRNPNAINAQTRRIVIPVQPSAAATPGCLSGGPIGVLLNGVVLFDALDATNRDAVAHETQDVCQGHPAPGNEYHYHSVPSCLIDANTGPSSVVGWAADGYPIAVERDAAGKLPTNADLDECHGRTSPITIDGSLITTYHYDATLEFPYTLGCYRGTAATPARRAPQ